MTMGSEHDADRVAPGAPPYGPPGFDHGVNAVMTVLHHSRTTGTDRVVLAAIACRYGNGGHPMPSVDAIAEVARVSYSAVERSLRRIEAVGELRTHAGHGLLTAAGHRTSLYEVLVACPPCCSTTLDHTCKVRAAKRDCEEHPARVPRDHGKSKGKGGARATSNTGGAEASRVDNSEAVPPFDSRFGGEKVDVTSPLDASGARTGSEDAASTGSGSASLTGSARARGNQPAEPTRGTNPLREGPSAEGPTPPASASVRTDVEVQGLAVKATSTYLRWANGDGIPRAAALGRAAFVGKLTEILARRPGNELNDLAITRDLPGAAYEASRPALSSHTVKGFAGRADDAIRMFYETEIGITLSGEAAAA